MDLNARVSDDGLSLGLTDYTISKAFNFRHLCEVGRFLLIFFYFFLRVHFILSSVQ